VTDRLTLWLVGMMGAGKSTVGPVLARRLGWRFVDTDAEIAKEAGRSIPAIFAEEGEPAFRERERKAVAAVAGTDAVVALGGGAIAAPGARKRLEASGIVVYLRARPETLLRRLGDDRERPLLEGGGPARRRARLEALLAERREAYESAGIIVDTDDLDAEQVAARVLGALEAGGEGLKDPARGAAAGSPRRRIDVALGDRSYPVVIGVGSLPAAGGAIAERTGSSAAVVVTEAGIGRRYAGALMRSLREAGMRAGRIDVPGGDATKNLRQVARLYEAFLDRGVDRGTAIVALGGGMVGDLAGFAAASFLRGLPFVQVPTTLLAMVDSSVGGKVGVNLPRGKNLVGAFHQPKLVWIDTTTLHSLPARQLAAGFAEVIKAAAIADAAFFARLERDVEGLLGLDPSLLVPVLARACAIKAEIVSRDEREGGVRMLLNLGHTLAHAVETLTRYRGVLHGEAVAMGMVYAARRSEALDLAPPGTADRIQALAERAGLPVELPDFPRRAYLSAIRVDKKRRDARIRYIVLREIGRAEAVPLTPAEILPARPRGRTAAAPRRRRR
jgi:shikimate kinase/3-dehydroquinate synthase